MMWNPFKKKSGQKEAGKKRHNHHNILTPLFRRQEQEIIKIEFLQPASCYDTEKETIFPQEIRPGTYELVKSNIAVNDSKEGKNYWYLFRGESRGLTERTLNQLIKSGKARIVS